MLFSFDKQGIIFARCPFKKGTANSAVEDIFGSMVRKRLDFI